MNDQNFLKVYAGIAAQEIIDEIGAAEDHVRRENERLKAELLAARKQIDRLEERIGYLGSYAAVCLSDKDIEEADLSHIQAVAEGEVFYGHSPGDIRQLAALFLTGPSGEALQISGPLETGQNKFRDTEFRFAVTDPATGNRFGVYAGITELSPEVTEEAAR